MLQCGGGAKCGVVQTSHISRCVIRCRAPNGCCGVADGRQPLARNLVLTMFSCRHFSISQQKRRWLSCLPSPELVRTTWHSLQWQCCPATDTNNRPLLRGVGVCCCCSATSETTDINRPNEWPEATAQLHPPSAICVLQLQGLQGSLKAPPIPIQYKWLIYLIDKMGTYFQNQHLSHLSRLSVTIKPQPGQCPGRGHGASVCHMTPFSKH